MWGFNRRNIPLINYNEDSNEDSKSDDSNADENFNSPITSGPPGTPSEEDPQGLRQLREAADQCWPTRWLSKPRRD